VQSALDNEGASCLNGTRFSTRSSLIVDTVTNAMGHGTPCKIWRETCTARMPTSVTETSTPVAAWGGQGPDESD